MVITTSSLLLYPDWRMWFRLVRKLSLPPSEYRETTLRQQWQDGYYNGGGRYCLCLRRPQRLRRNLINVSRGTSSGVVSRLCRDEQLCLFQETTVQPRAKSSV